MKTIYRILLTAICSHATILHAQIYLGFTSSDNVHYVVTDPHGRRTGHDPRGSTNRAIGNVLNEIPNALYSIEGPGDSPDTTDKDILYHVFSYKYVPPQGDGTYIVQVIGISSGQYEFYGHVTALKLPSSPDCYFELKNAPIEADSVTTYRFTYGSSQTSLNSFVKLVTPSSLIQDVAVMRKLSWITSQSTADKYTGLFTTVRNQLNTKDSVSARILLTTTSAQLQQDSIAGLLSANAYHSLQSDVLQLVNQLPVAPHLSSFLPSSVVAGSTGFMITVSGWNFTNGSVVIWNGSQRTTTYAADTILQANILSSGVAVADSPLVTVKNPDGTMSNGIRFHVLPKPSGGIVKLINSTGANLTGGSLQYYDGSWKDAVNHNDGTFFVSTSLKTLSLRMTYAYGSQTLSNVTVGYDTVVFRTTNAQIRLQNSLGTTIDTGSVQYYAGAWRALGTTSGGVASMELLPGSYSFRMTYAYGSNDKQQDIGINPTVVFQTVNAAIQLKNSQGSLIDTGSVQYYAGAWRPLGTTIGGVATKELLPASYSFRMSYAYGSNDKQQDIGANPTVVFQTVNATVQLRNSQATPIDQGSVQYYAGAWRSFGTTTNGSVAKELLPNSYPFRMTYAYLSNDKTQDIGSNPTVSYSTVACTVRVKDAHSNPLNNATVTYYAGAWRTFGQTSSGQTTMELLPASVQFRAKYASIQADNTQDLTVSPTVDITLNVTP